MTQRERVKAKMSQFARQDITETEENSLFRLVQRSYDKIGYDRSGLAEQFPPFQGIDAIGRTDAVPR